MHIHLAATHRAAWHKFRWNAAILCPPHHFPDEVFIVVQLFVASVGALQVGIITLHGKDAFLVKAGLLELPVHIGGYHEIVFSLYGIEQ